MTSEHKIMIYLVCATLCATVMNFVIVAFNAGNIIDIKVAADIVRDGCVK